MNKTTIGITFLLCVAAALSVLYLANGSDLQIKDSDLISLYISIAACLGALVSATFVVFSYLQTNNAYIEAQRPHRLAMMESLVREGTGEPVSRVHYQNITNNRFTDLTLDIKVTAGNREYSLSELFRKKMTMIGRDQRQRSFHPLKELQALGLDLQSTAESGNEVTLDVSYEYTFNKKKDVVNAQMYRWNASRREWEIK